MVPERELFPRHRNHRHAEQGSVRVTQAFDILAIVHTSPRYVVCLLEGLLDRLDHTIVQSFLVCTPTEEQEQCTGSNHSTHQRDMPP